MTPCKVLLVDAGRRASAPILTALREAGFALQVISRLSQLSLACDRPFDVIAILGEHSEFAWANQLKPLSPHTAVVLLCSGPHSMNSFLPPVDALCPTDSPCLVVHAHIVSGCFEAIIAFPIGDFSLCFIAAWTCRI